MPVLVDTLRQFLHRTNGSVTMIFAVVFMALFTFIGLAVDYSRWSNAHSKSVDALDAALLAAGRALQSEPDTSAAIAVAKSTFLANARDRLSLLDPTIDVQLVDNGTALEGKAHGRIATPFLGLINFRQLELTATSRVGFSVGSGTGSGGSDLEISMMLDVTGSMCDDGSGPCTTGAKIDAMKLAATDLINIIMKSKSSNVRAALVPFSTRMVVGPPLDSPTETLMKKLTNLDNRWTGWTNDGSDCTSWTPGSTSEDPGTGGTCATWTPTHHVDWSLAPCVTDRTGPNEFTDAAPGPNNWLNGQEGGRLPLSLDSSDTPIADGSGTGKTPGDLSDQWNYNDSATCWDVDYANTVMPLTSDKDALLQRINQLVGYGATSGALGTAWTWYALSPNWNALFSGTSAPGSYADTVPSGSNPPKLRKIAVLMTDGVYNAYRGWMAQDPVMVSNNAKSICNNMKAAGVEVYTVGFDLDSLPAAEKARAIDTLQTCGSDLSHFYEALSADQLKQSFRDIAMQLSQLFIAR